MCPRALSRMFLLAVSALSRCDGFAAETLSFADSFGDHMVLQQLPAPTVIWGVGAIPNSTVSVVRMTGSDGTPGVNGNTVANASGVWRVEMAGAMAGNESFSFKASSGTDLISINDVVYGDVWLCSGQSNMAVVVSMVFNASQVIAEAAKYAQMPTNPLRLFAVNMSCAHDHVCHFQSDQARLSKCTRPPCFTTGPNAGWTPTTPDAISTDGKGHAKAEWTGSFSAVCYLFGRRVQAARNYPIGLISSYIGGTPDECWSSKEALATCPSTPHSKAHMDWGDCWYSMITPLLRTPIFGAIWYQGETDTSSGGSSAGALRAANYNCTFPSMIRDWRSKFYEKTLGATDPHFPFGVVQLAPWSSGRDDDNDGCGQRSESCQVAVVRWAQTQAVRELPNMFEAISLDLGDFSSPFGSIHPRHKIAVGDRLSLGAQAVAYNDPSTYWTGPIGHAAWAGGVGGGLRIQFSNCSDGGIELRALSGFEVRVDEVWRPASALRNPATQARCTVDLEPASRGATEVRYNWFRVACFANETHDGSGTGRCAVYSGGQVPPCKHDAQIGRNDAPVGRRDSRIGQCVPNNREAVSVPAGPFIMQVSSQPPPVRVCVPDISNPTFHAPGLSSDICREYCSGGCVLPGPKYPGGEAGKVQLVNMTRITPREIDDVVNKDFGDLPADYSFMLMQKEFYKHCETEPTGYTCKNGTGHFLKPCSPDQVFMTWEVKVDGNWGPYSKCNPSLDKFPHYDGFRCGIWDWDKKTHVVQPSIDCGNCSRTWSSVGWESRAKHHPGKPSFSDVLSGNWFSLPASSECKGTREPGDGLAPVCAWKVNRLITIRNATCVMYRVTAAAKLNQTVAPCFERCTTEPLEPNETLADCELGCVLRWAGVVTRQQLLQPFERSFLSAAEGGCPELPPLSY